MEVDTLLEGVGVAECGELAEEVEGSSGWSFQRKNLAAAVATSEFLIVEVRSLVARLDDLRPKSACRQGWLRGIGHKRGMSSPVRACVGAGGDQLVDRRAHFLGGFLGLFEARRGQISKAVEFSRLEGEGVEEFAEYIG